MCNGVVFRSLASSFPFYWRILGANSRSDINQPSTRKTHVTIYDPRRQISDVIFFAKSCTFGAAILTINDFFILTQAWSIKRHALTHIPTSSWHIRRVRVLIQPATHPPNLSPSRFHLQSARFSLQSTIPPLFGWLNCRFALSFCFLARRCRQGRVAKYSFCSCFPLFIYIHIHTHTHTHIYILASIVLRGAIFWGLEPLRTSI